MYLAHIIVAKESYLTSHADMHLFSLAETDDIDIVRGAMRQLFMFNASQIFKGERGKQIYESRSYKKNM